MGWPRAVRGGEYSLCRPGRFFRTRNGNVAFGRWRSRCAMRRGCWERNWRRWKPSSEASGKNWGRRGSVPTKQVKSMNEGNPIEIEHLTKYYGKHEVVRDLSLSIRKGQIYGFLGRNGAGKTTSIRILLGFEQPTRGSARILGEDSRAIRPETRGRIGYLPEGHHVYGWMTVRECGQFQGSFFPTWNQEIFEAVISHFRLTPKMKAGHLSRGQRAGLCLAMTLAPEPDDPVFIPSSFRCGASGGPDCGAGCRSAPGRLHRRPVPEACASLRPAIRRHATAHAGTSRAARELPHERRTRDYGRESHPRNDFEARIPAAAINR